MQSASKDEALAETSVGDTEDSSADEVHHDGNSKKRKRPQKISCELCKARKVKCDKQEPACGWCARNNRLCIYQERKKPGLRASYGVDLEDKVNRMEAKLHLLGEELEDHIAASRYQPSSSSEYRSDIHRVVNGPFLRDNFLSNTPSLHSAWLHQPLASHSNGGSTLQSEIALKSALAGQKSATRSTEQSLSSPQIGVESSRGEELPPSGHLFSLVDLYFKHVNPWSPILDRKATFDILRSLDNLTEDEATLLFAIVAVTLRFFKNPNLEPELRRRYYDSSRRKVQLYALEHPSVRAMQALALITIDAHGTSSGINGWNLLALLCRNIIQLGLGVESSVYLKPSTEQTTTYLSQSFALPPPESWIEEEGRRRLFWLAYITDRYATISTRFDFTLDEKETSRPLPCRYDLFSKDQPVETRWFRVFDSTNVILDNAENLGSFSYHCEVLRILSQIHRFLRNPVDIESITEVNKWRDTYRELDSKLSTWLAHLPGEYGKISQLCHSDPGSRVSNWIMIHAAFVTSVIRLHSVAAYPTSTSGIFLPSFNAVQRCLAAVESLRAIAQDVLDGRMLDLLGPPFAFSLWTCGRLLLVHAATMDNTVDPIINFLISTLSSMGEYWEIARNWAKILNRLVREGQQAEDDAHHNRLLSSSKTYKNMRRTAHHLASLASRKPRSVLDPTLTRSTSLAELEYVDVFDWFNYPRLSAERSHQGTVYSPSDHTGYTQTTQVGSFTAPNPDSDGLNFKQPYEFKPPYE